MEELQKQWLYTSQDLVHLILSLSSFPYGILNNSCFPFVVIFYVPLRINKYLGTKFLELI